MKIRIDKMLSNVGLGSRKQIKQDAKGGKIRVNDEVVKDSSQIIDTDKDEVKYNGEIVEYIQYIYLMMNKPAGVVSATEDNYDKTVIDLLEDKENFYEPFPVGRLDKDTEGLLLLTNDGKLSHNLLSPKKHVDKVYYVETAEDIIEDDIKAFEEGVILENENYKTLPAKLVILNESETSDSVLNETHVIQCTGSATQSANSVILSESEESPLCSNKCLLAIKEGKFHQVKRMFKAVNNEVIYLKRISMGPIQLDKTLKLGEYRHLTDDEIKLLKDAN